MDNTNQELYDFQNIVDTSLSKKEGDMADIGEENKINEEELIQSEKPDDSQKETKSDEKCTEEELKNEESISITNNEILQNINILSAKMDSLNMLFSEKIVSIERDGKIIHQMHEELQKYIDDIAQLVKPVLLDIIEVRDDMLRVSDHYLKEPKGKQDIPNETFTFYTLAIQDKLEKNGVEIYKSNSGDLFVPIKHRVIKKVETEKNELNGKVCESLSSGYNYKGRTISAEKVTVYYYQDNHND